MKKKRIAIVATNILSMYILLVFSACEKTSSEPETNLFDIQSENEFIGMVEGTNAFVSILLAEKEEITCECNMDEEISIWFKGPAFDYKKISITNVEGAKIMSGFVENSFEVEIYLRDGRKFLFDAKVNTGIYWDIYRFLSKDAVQDEKNSGLNVKSEENKRVSFKIKNVTHQNTALSGKNIRDIHDETSNTLVLSDTTKKSFSFFRFKVETPTTRAPNTPISLF